MGQKSNIGRIVGKTAGVVTGICMIVFSVIASPFVWWMLAGDDEGSSFSVLSIIALIIVCVVLIVGIALVILSLRRKHKK